MIYVVVVQAPAEDDVMFQHEGSAVEGGLGSKLIVPAGNKVVLFPW